MTSPTTTGTQCGTPPPLQPQDSDSSILPPPGEDYLQTPYAHRLEHSLATLPSMTQHPLGSGGLDSSTAAYGVVTTSPPLFIQHQSEPISREVEEAREREFTSYAAGPGDELAPLQAVSEKSDVFAGTSQAYSAPTDHSEYLAQHPNPLNREPAYESLVTNHNEHQVTTASVPEIEMMSSSLQQMGLRQLGVLYKARGRHIAELTQQISAQAEDNERHIRILRHEKVC